MASLRICFASCSPMTSSNVRQPLVRIVSSMAPRLLDDCLSTTGKQMSSMGPSLDVCLSTTGKQVS